MSRRLGGKTDEIFSISNEIEKNWWNLVQVYITRKFIKIQSSELNNQIC